MVDDEIKLVVSSQFDFDTIRVATNNFSDANKLGQGGFGPVYKVNIASLQLNLSVFQNMVRPDCWPIWMHKTPLLWHLQGTLFNKQEVAIKRLSSNSCQGNIEFKNEVILMSRLQHRNLVRLLGFCYESEERLLVYEFLPNKSLDKIIFGKFAYS